MRTLRLTSQGKTRDLDDPELGALDGWCEATEDDGAFNNNGGGCGLKEGEVVWVLTDETATDKLRAEYAEWGVETERDDWGTSAA